MATARRFQDLEAWQKARVLTRRIYGISRQGAFGRDFVLGDQLRRASISVMANLAEGFGYMAGRQFGRFLSMARGSCAEVASHLYVACDAGYIDHAEFEMLLAEVDHVNRMIRSLHMYLETVSSKSSQQVRPSR